MSEIDVEDILNEVVEVSDEHRQTVSVCSETLSKMGYEIIGKPQDANDLIVRYEDKSYTIIVASDASNDNYLGIPVDNIGHGINIFKMTADYIAFHHNDYIYQFKVDELCELLQPTIVKLKSEKPMAYAARESAIDTKRLHAKYDYNRDSYDIILYVPIESLCKRLQCIKQKAG